MWRHLFLHHQTALQQNEKRPIYVVVFKTTYGKVSLKSKKVERKNVLNSLAKAITVWEK